jgi:hypothetical protein
MRWNSCNILQLAPDAKRLWQFNAKGSGFVLGGEQRVARTEPLPKKNVAKTWSSLWSPKLNIAWLPPENVFLRAVELPASSPDEIFSMVEFQLEKISPLPVTQIVWTYQVMPELTSGNLQTVVVVVVPRSAVEEFLGRLEKDGFSVDRLEVPMLDQLATIPMTESGAWIFPQIVGGQNAALVAWCAGGTLRHLNFLTLPAAGDAAAEIKNQITHTVWSGEIEGWMPESPKWHLVADAVNAAEWEKILRAALDEPVKIVAPMTAADLAAATAKRAAAGSKTVLMPPEFSTRYRQQFVDRLWLHGLGYAGVLYAVFLAVYFCATTILGYRTEGVETQVAGLANTYTNSLQLTAQYKILTERQQLKYAALDCWKLVAEQLPQSVTLQRFSFANGQTLSLSGSAPQEEFNTLLNFNTAMQKAKNNGQFVFDQHTGEPVNPRLTGNVLQWSFSLNLLHPEAIPQ